jgi:arthrofactin-type cyclic lipopeptide synthetase B
LAVPIAYRDHVAQALMQIRTQDAEAFFRRKLQDVVEPTALFGLLDVLGVGRQIEEAQIELGQDLALRLRIQARNLGVSAARLFHAAWGLTVAKICGQEDVVYGTVLLATPQRSASAPRLIGLSVNTLPLRLRFQGVTAKELIEQTHQELAELLNYASGAGAALQRNCRRGASIQCVVQLST